MSNQTFIKKDRISFAQNFNENIVLSPINSNLFIGPNSAISYDVNSNVVSINPLQGIILSNNYIYADGTYLSNIPSGFAQSSITSSIIGLGNVGYVSSSQLVSSINAVYGVYVSAAVTLSSIQGFANYYFSSSTLLFSAQALLVIFNESFTSTTTGLGSAGYISSTQLTSTVKGLGDIYLSSINNSLASTTIGLGNLGYISSTQLTSTVKGLGNIYNSTSSDWYLYPALGTVDFSNNNTINNNFNLYTDLQVGPPTGLSNGLFSFYGYFCYSNCNVSFPTPIASDWSLFQANCNINMCNYAIYNAGGVESSYVSMDILYGLTNPNITVYASLDLQNFNISNVAQGQISSLNVNSLTFGDGTGWVDFGALRAVIVSTIELDTGILNTSSITFADGSIQNTAGGGGSASNWWMYPALGIVDLSNNYTFYNYLNFYTDLNYVGQPTGYSNGLVSFYGYFCYYNSNSGPPTPIAADWSYFSANSNVNINNYTISNAGYIIPAEDLTYDLGSISLRWANTFVSTINFADGSYQTTAGGGGGQDWWMYPALGIIDFSNNNTSNNQFNEYTDLNNFSNPTGLLNGLLSFNGYFAYYNSNYSNSPIPIAADWSLFPANSNINMCNYAIYNAGGVESSYVSMDILYGLTNPNIIVYASLDLQNYNISNIAQGQISSLNVNSLSFGDGTGWVDFGAVRAVIVSTIELDAGILNTSSITFADGSVQNTAGGGGSASNWWQYPAAGTVDISSNTLNNVNQISANSLILVDTVHGYTTTFSNYQYGAVFDTNSSQYSFTNSGGTESAVIQVEYAGVAGGYLYIDITGNFHLSNSSGSLIADGNLVASQSLNVDYIYTNSNSAVQFPSNSIDMTGNNIYNVGEISLVSYSPYYANMGLTYNFDYFPDPMNGYCNYYDILNIDGQPFTLYNGPLGLFTLPNIYSLVFPDYNNNYNTYLYANCNDNDRFYYNIYNNNTSLNISNRAIAQDWWAYNAESNVDLSDNQISNIQVNYSNIFSNTSIVPSLIAASPQTFNGAIFNQTLNLIPYTLATTNSESNYLYFTSNQSMWKIHITLNGILSANSDTLQIYFTLSNITSGIETPLIINTSNNSFILIVNGDNTILSLNDTINLTDIITSSMNPYTPISLNMYCLDKFGYNFYSSNINTWNNPNNISDLQNGNAVAYGNNTWIAVGLNNIGNAYMATSYDNGVTWVGTDLSNFIYEPYSVCYGNGIWLIGSFQGANLVYSTDATNFVPSPLNIFIVTLGIAYGNGVYVAGGVPNNSSNYTIAYSTDGINWIPSSTTPSNIVNNISYANGIFVAVGDDSLGGLVTSPDGINWNQYSVSQTLNCVTYGAGRWYASDGNGNLYYSTDNWYSYSVISGTPNFGSLAFGDTFVGTDYTSNIYYSGDFGFTWSNITTSLGSTNYIAYANGVYITVGNIGNSNCILTTRATNMLTYTLEPVTIQPQSYVLTAPIIDWVNTNYDIYGNLTITWFPVPNATSYKIFMRNTSKVNANKYTTKAAVPLNRSLNTNLFDSDSGPIIGNSAVVPSGSIELNYYVFAYRNGLRSSFPIMQIYTGNGLQLWPVEQLEFHGGSNSYNCTTFTIRNLYTNKSILLTSNVYNDSNYRSIQSAIIGTNTYLSNH